jgi:hypothetical protein
LTTLHLLIGLPSAMLGSALAARNMETAATARMSFFTVFSLAKEFAPCYIAGIRNVFRICLARNALTEIVKFDEIKVR